jgi:hypothetical protein
MRSWKAGWSIGFATCPLHGNNIFLQNPPKLIGTSDYHNYYRRPLFDSNHYEFLIQYFFFVILGADSKCHNNNHSSLLSLWNLKIMKDTLRLLSFHLCMLPYAVTIAYPFGSSRGLRTCIQPCKKGRVWAAAGMHSLRKTCKPGSNPYLTTPYTISDARILARREGRDSNPQHANMLSRHIYR